MAGELILVVDDEEDITQLIAFNLRQEGYRSLQAYDGPDALQMVRTQAPDLIILDVMLPSMDGAEVCSRLKLDRATRDIPVLMLTAKGLERDRVRAFELGADDYVVKPFSVRELMLRVRAILRRQAVDDDGRTHDDAGVAVVGALRVERASHRVFVHGSEIGLTRIEFDLLCYLLDRPERALSRDLLLTAVWGYDSTSLSRTVDTHIKRLREKLGPAASLIETVRGTGYRVRHPSPQGDKREGTP